MAVPATEPQPPASQDPAVLASWLRLANTPGVGRIQANRLLQHYHTPQGVFDAANDHHAAFAVPALARKLAGAAPDHVRALVDASLDWAAQRGNCLLTPDQPAYPPRLRHIAQPPLALFAKGCTALLQRDAVAVVGSRNATVQGQRNAEGFARALADAGLLIVSGLALGIDGAAHLGGLAGAGGTAAVIGTGIDRIYPRRHAELGRRIAAEGCLLSEFPLGTPSKPENFPIRNRIIAGIARATLVVEAALESGSLITAGQAADEGREVFVIPGSIHSPLSKGGHALIRQGARLVESVGDILVDMGLQAPQVSLASVTASGGLLLETITFEPIPADELAERLQLDPAETQASLLALELAGLVERLPGGAFQRLKA